MDCEKLERVLMDLLYDEVDELTGAAARRHLEHCQRCSAIHAGLRATRQAVSLPPLAPPPELHTKILAAERRVREALPLRRRLGRGVSIVANYAMRPQLAMAALLLLMVGSGLVFLRGRPSTPEVIALKDAPLSLEEERPHAAEVAPSPLERAAAPREEQRADHAGPYDAAMEAFRAGRYAEARQGFAAIAAEGGADAASAALLEAQAARSGEGCLVAAARFEAVSERYAGTSVAKEAAWQAASCYRSLGKDAEARRNYGSLVGVAGYTERAQQALDELGAADAVAARRPAAPPKAAPATAAKPSKPTSAAEAPAAAGARTGPASARPTTTAGAKPRP